MTLMIDNKLVIIYTIFQYMKQSSQTSETIWDEKYNLSSTSLGFLIWELNNTIELKMNQMLKEFGITRFQFYILQSLVTAKTHDLEFTQNEFANFIHANKMMVSKVLRQMESRELIRRVKNPTDNRSMIISLTNTGSELHQKAMQKVQQQSKHVHHSFMSDPDFMHSIQQLIHTIKG
jgi:DNA-binding MarR family transcriptional regulator